MNAGLSNLATLKAWLLTPALRTGTDYDDEISRIGLGVAAQIEKACNRRFSRAVDYVEIVSADRTHYVTQRYPIETVTTIEVQQVKQDGWAVLPDLIVNEQLAAGLLYFYGQQGWQRGLIRLTYTGGYWYETVEPTDVGYPTAMPAGATAIDPDLQLAWLMQCEHVWQQHDKLGIAIAEKPEQIYSGALAKVRLLDDVREKLQPFMRYQMS